MPRFGPHTISEACVFYRNAHALAFTNLRPVLPGHVLVVPTRVEARFGALSSEEVAALWQAAQRVGRVVCAVHGGSAATYSMQDGRAAGQSVPHVHVHVVPRADGDLENNDDIYDMLELGEKELVNSVSDSGIDSSTGGHDDGRGSGGGSRARTALAVDPRMVSRTSAQILPPEQRRARTAEEQATEAALYRRKFEELERMDSLSTLTPVVAADSAV